MSKDDITIIVDDNDNIIGHKASAEISPDERTRIAAIWIENPEGQVLLAQRHSSKWLHPNKWGPAAVEQYRRG